MECASSKPHLRSLLPQFETNTLSLLEVALRTVQCGQRAVLKMSVALLCLVGNSNCLSFSPLLLGIKSTTTVPARCQGPLFFFKLKTAIQLHKVDLSRIELRLILRSGFSWIPPTFGWTRGIIKGDLAHISFRAGSTHLTCTPGALNWRRPLTLDS